MSKLCNMYHGIINIIPVYSYVKITNYHSYSTVKKYIYDFYDDVLSVWAERVIRKDIVTTHIL